MESAGLRCRANSEKLPDAPDCVSSYGSWGPEAPTTNLYSYDHFEDSLG